MKYHETFLAAHPEMLREWRNAESFHALLVHLILPVVIIVGIISFILKGCEPPELEEQKAKAPAVEDVQETDADAPENEVKTDVAPAVETGEKITAPETVPQA